MNKTKNKAIDRQGRVPVHVFINGPAQHSLHSFSLYFYLSPFGLGYNGKGVRINPQNLGEVLPNKF